MYVVCQKAEHSTVYYYEDINYLRAGDSNADTDELKVLNDWGKTLDDTKMSKRSVKITLDITLVRDRILVGGSDLVALLNNNGLNGDDMTEIVYCDSDCESNELYVAHYNDLPSVFFVINTQGELFHEELTGTDDYRDTVIKLKSESGWKKP